MSWSRKTKKLDRKKKKFKQPKQREKYKVAVAVPTIVPVLFDVGKKYNWINQPERLVYLGYNFSGNGFWHQFALVDTPDKIWCECLDSDLKMIEATKEVLT